VSEVRLSELHGEATRQIYERGSYGRTLRLGRKPAVLVVDLSYGFTDPDSPLGCDLSAAVNGTRRVLDAARAASAFVVFTTIAYSSDLSDAGLIMEKLPLCAELTVGSRWVQLDRRLGVRPEEAVITKRGSSAFFGTDLASILARKAIDTVILCGASTSGCVRATAVDLMQYGFPALVVSDCVADRAAGPHDASLFDIQAKYGDVVASDHAIDYLTGLPDPRG
jgi:maleamate amidohydrolase